MLLNFPWENPLFTSESEQTSIQFSADSAENRGKAARQMENLSDLSLESTEQTKGNRRQREVWINPKSGLNGRENLGWHLDEDGVIHTVQKYWKHENALHHPNI